MPMPLEEGGVKFTQEEQEKCRESFLAFDLDRSGSIDQWELKSALTAFGVQATDEEIFCLISEVDQNKNGCIDYGEYVTILLHVKEKNSSLSSKNDLSALLLSCVAVLPRLFFFHLQSSHSTPPLFFFFFFSWCICRLWRQQRLLWKRRRRPSRKNCKGGLWLNSGHTESHWKVWEWIRPTFFWRVRATPTSYVFLFFLPVVLASSPRPTLSHTRATFPTPQGFLPCLEEPRWMSRERISSPLALKWRFL